MKEQRPNQRKG